MANTLTNLAPDLYAALDTVSRELVGMIPSVSINASGIERAAVGQITRVPVVGAANVSDITPAMGIPDPTDQTVGNVEVTITKSRAAEFGFVGEEQRSLRSGAGYMNIQADMIAQAMRSLVNEVEADLTATYVSTSRAYGTAGTTPFGSTVGDIAQMHKILVDNGAPVTDKQMVLNTTSGVNLRSLANLTNVNNAGTSEMLRDGIFGRLEGFAVRESGQFASHAGGTVTDTTVTGVNAVGATTINVTTAVTTGAVTLTAGDVISFAGDTNKYVVAADVTIADNTTGDIVIAAPGLRETTAGGEAVSVSASYAVNMAFDRNAIQLVTRAPALPEEGDLALDRMTITDPMSGLSFEVSVYGGYRKVRYEIALAWGVKVIKSEHCALLVG